MKIYLLLIFVLCSSASAQVIYAQDEALERAFSGAREVIRTNVILNSDQAESISSRYRVSISKGIVSFFEGIGADGHSLGYAFIDSGVIRSHTGVFMVVLLPDGTTKDVFVLAFNEPPEHIPSDRWLDQLNGKPVTEQPVPGKNVPTIMGSTLSVIAITNSVRRVQALYKEVVMSGK